MEAETVRVTGENVLLKQLILDSRQKQAVMQDKMEKVLKTLYNMFMGGGNSNNLSILHNPGGGQIAGGPNMVPLPPRSSLAPQMLESLIFRLDSLQTYGLRYVTKTDSLFIHCQWLFRIIPIEYMRPNHSFISLFSLFSMVCFCLTDVFSHFCF